MSYLETRNAQIIMKEAELLSGSNDFVYHFYLSYTQQRLEILVDSETEKGLLHRDDKFIDLTLAKYSRETKTLSALFVKSLLEKNLPLRLACLSNRVNSDLPDALFEQELVFLADWFSGITQEEITVLFSNETINDRFVIGLLDCDKDLWRSISEEKQIKIIRALRDNKRVAENYSEPVKYFYSYSGYLHEKLFTAIWNLAKKAPVNEEWALHLGLLLERVMDKRHDFDNIAVAERWNVNVAEEKNKNRKINLNGFELVRRTIYQNVIQDFPNEEKSNATHFNHTDIAYRACAYQQLKYLTAEDIKEAYQKDNLIAIDHLMKNKRVWQSQELRETLKEICWDADSNRKNFFSHLDRVEDYEREKENLKKQYPEWFEEKPEEEVINEDEEPLKLGLAKELIQESNHHQSVEILTEIMRLRTAISDATKYIKWIFYIGLIALVVYLIK